MLISKGFFRAPAIDAEAYRRIACIGHGSNLPRRFRLDVMEKDPVDYVPEREAAMRRDAIGRENPRKSDSSRGTSQRNGRGPRKTQIERMSIRFVGREGARAGSIQMQGGLD